MSAASSSSSEQEALSAIPGSPQGSQDFAIEKAELGKEVVGAAMGRVLGHKALVVDHWEQMRVERFVIGAVAVTRRAKHAPEQRRAGSEVTD